MKGLQWMGLIVVTVVAIVATSPAVADPVVNVVATANAGVNVWVLGTGTAASGGVTAAVHSFNLTITALPSGPVLYNGVEAYCVDLTRYFGSPRVGELDSMDNWDLSGALSSRPSGYNVDVAQAKAIWLLNFARTLTSTDDKVAMQLAIWEVLYDTNGDVTSLNTLGFRAANTSAEILARANEFVGMAQSSHNLSAVWVRTDDDGNYYQDYGFGVPEPSTLLLLGVGILGAALLRRRS